MSGWQQYRNQIGLAGFALVAGLIPLFIQSPYILSILIFVGIFTIITIGLSLVMGYAGQISLGHAAFYGLGAYASAILTLHLGWSPWPAMVVSALLTGLIAYIVGIPIFRLRGHYLAMATLGLGVIIHLAMIEFRGLTGGPTGLSGIPRLSIGHFVFDGDVEYYYLVWTFVIVILILALNIVNSRVGRALRAIHGSEIAAETLGVNAGRYKLQILVVSAIFASLAGSLYTHYLAFVSPSNFGLLGSIQLVVMVAVGGLASIWGAPVGALTVYLITPLMREVMPRLLKFRGGEHEIIAYGIILVLIMIFMPEGLTAGVVNLFRRRGRRQSTSQSAT